MIYLNHAATSYPKLPQVKAAVLEYLEQPPCGQFRSTHGNSADLLKSCKQKLGGVFEIVDYERIIFTSGATEAANLLIQGMQLEGKTVLITSDAHNCILRPLYNHRGNRKVRRIPCDGFGVLRYDRMEEEMKQGAYALFINHCSNVTGMIANMEKISALCKKYGVLMIVDVSQSAGCIPVKMEQWQADGLIFTAHKSLLGIPGLGGFYAKDPLLIKPVKFGGTGKNSDIVMYSKEEKNYDFEVGTQNGPGIAALNAALDVLSGDRIEQIHKMEKEMISYLAEELKKLKNIRIYGKEGEDRGSVLSFNAQGLSPSDVGYILENGYGIVTRTGLHCAPLIHEDLGTKSEGCVRVSISLLTSWKEMEEFIAAMQEITNNAE